MAVPRPVLLALLGLALCAAAFMATRGAREPGGSAITATPATPAPVTHKAAPLTHKGAKAHAHKAAPASHKSAKPASKAEVHKAAPATHKVAKPAAVKPQQSAAQRLVVKVTGALAQHKAVIFFFTRPGAADDTGTRQAVNAVAHNPRVLVVRAGLKDLSTFRPVLSGAGVSQVPAVVVAHAGKPAQLVQGYVDPGTLRQTIADALR